MHVRDSSVGNSNPNVEQKHQPGLRVQECLGHLLLFERFVFNSRLTSSNSVDGNCFLALGDEFDLHRIIWEEYSNDDRSHQCRRPGDPEEVPLLVTAGNEADSVPNWTSKTDRETGAHQAGPDGLLSICTLDIYP